MDLFPTAQSSDLSIAASKKLQQQRRILGEERLEQNNKRTGPVGPIKVLEAFTEPAPAIVPKYIRINGRELIGLMRSLRMWSGVLRRRLEREFFFQNSDEALRFVNYVQGVSLRLNHYPKITLLKTRVLIQLRTTEVDGISNKDVELAQLIDELAV